MHLAALLPRPLTPENGPESPTIMNCLLTGVHLERRRARAVGWRGVRASAGGMPAWTCRVAGTPHVYGLVFCEEHSNGEALHGEFAAYVFPKAEDPLLDVFPLRALALALGPDYEDAVRELSVHAPALDAFLLGHVGLTAALDGSGLALTLAAPAVVGVYLRKAWPRRGHKKTTAWIVLPGGLEYDVPAFRLLLRPFAALASTAGVLLGDEPRLRIGVARHAAPAAGCRVAAPGSSAAEEVWLTLRAALGASDISLSAAKAEKSEEKLVTSLPVMHVLTGFLGAGKTTFLRRWLDYLNGREQFAAVIQNELGSIAWMRP